MKPIEGTRVTKFFIWNTFDDAETEEELRRQLYQFGDETTSDPARAEEIVVLPGADTTYAATHGIPVCEAHREPLADGGFWRLVYEGTDEVAPPTTNFTPNWGGHLDGDGMHADAGVGSSAITTVSGKRVDPLNLTVDDIDIDDIAHSLARQCRYGGHVQNFLSVARHSIWVSRRLAGDPALELWGLLHDAGEAYVGDVVKPLKHDPSMVAFRDIEAAVDRTIAEAFDLPYPMPDAVHEADRFVTVECEIGIGLKDAEGNCFRDHEEFLEAFYRLEEW